MISPTRVDCLLLRAVIIILSCVSCGVSAMLELRDSNGDVCMLVDANFSILVTAKKDGDAVRQTTLENFNLQQGGCDDALATLVMNCTVGENTMFRFVFNKVGISVKLVYSFSFYPSDLFPELPGQKDYTYKGYISKGRRISSDKSSFKCNTEQTTQLTYDPASTPPDAGSYTFSVQLTMRNIQVQAFNVKDGKFSPAARCLADSNRQKLSVGVVVVVVVLVVLPLALTTVAVVVVLHRNRVSATAAPVGWTGWWRKILPKQ
ncbi:V-type proton ATPase subunit S1-like protein [Elysia marginata]|uniref:V-type proton ATPase subunit S1-like protein n=1 Tax=Elysia marginata TaxID=1093978 RepID=A0AAV4EEK4_9GAST|nr:V-type proton ATPase subunit S1-like protein [Elysia marginata]